MSDPPQHVELPLILKTADPSPRIERNEPRAPASAREGLVTGAARRLPDRAGQGGSPRLPTLQRKLRPFNHA